MNDESLPLLSQQQRGIPTSVRRVVSTSLLLGCVLGVALWRPDAGQDGAVAPTLMTRAAGDAEQIPSVVKTTPTYLSDWYIYKVTATIRPLTDFAVQKFVGRYIMPTSYSSPESVGCNNTHVGGDWKVNFTAPGNPVANNQFHWVNAPRLHGAGTAAKWVNIILNETLGTTSFRDDGLRYRSETATFNAFMHDKIQLYANDLAGWASRLDEDSVAHLKRKSTVRTSATDSTLVELGHLSVPLEGRVFEIVGPLATITNGSRDAFTSWSAVECPSAHGFTDDFETIESRFSGTANTTMWTDSSRGDRQDERPQPMLVAVHVSISNSAPAISGRRDELTHLNAFTRATVEIHSTSDGGETVTADESMCSVASLSWDSMPGTVVKYVQNTHPDLKSAELLVEYENAWGSMHDSTFFTDLTSSGMSYDDDIVNDTAIPSASRWDNFLDTHIGFITDQTEDACNEGVEALNEALDEAGVGFAIREEQSEIHVYTGYASTLSVEYNFGGTCSDYSFTDICACISVNAADAYNRVYNTSGCPHPH